MTNPIALFTTRRPQGRDDQEPAGGGAALHLSIEGRVQGVGFRWAMAQEAGRLGLRGWVRNRRDGSVEAVAIGSSSALADWCHWARRGPPEARVDRVTERLATEHELRLAGSGYSSLPTP